MFRQKKKEQISRTNPGFEESERKTPITGVLLLLLMFIIGTLFGWRALDDLGRVPSRPPDLSTCAGRYIEYGNLYEPSNVPEPRLLKPDWPQFYFYDDSSHCQYNDLEQKQNVPALITDKRLPGEKSLRELSDKYQNINNQYNQARQDRMDLEAQYGIGLQERQANLPKEIFPVTPAIQSNITDLRAEEERSRATVESYEAQRSKLQASLKAVDEEIKEAYKPVFAEHNRRLRVYEFKVFLLQFLLIVPLFLLLFWAYARQARKNSPYAIIITAMLGVVGLLLARVILLWFWDLFLARVIETLWRWIQNFQILRSLVFYGGMVLSFALFGGAVYYLQKKIFDPRRLTLRRFRAKQCPHCQASLDLAGDFCPNCGQAVREKCSACGKSRFIGLPVCPHCGAKAV